MEAKVEQVGTPTPFGSWAFILFLILILLVFGIGFFFV